MAFQALGYHYWNALCHSDKNKVDAHEIYEKLDISLSELAYEKVWSELSDTDKKVLGAINVLTKTGKTKSVKVEDLRKYLDMTSNTFTTYRTRLLDSGIVNGKQYGYLSFALPRFEEFIDSVEFE